MSDDTTLPGIDKTDNTDVTDNRLRTDFTRFVGRVVGKERIERKRQKIREELVRDHINSKQRLTPTLVPQFFNIFRHD